MKPSTPASYLENQEKLHTRYAILARQMEVLQALSTIQMLFTESDAANYDRCWHLRSRVAREVLINCEGIWLLFGPSERRE